MDNSQGTEPVGMEAVKQIFLQMKRSYSVLSDQNCLLRKRIKELEQDIETPKKKKKRGR
jgi:hypothetical protein